MSLKRKAVDNNDNGFGEWGGYMSAKKAKLLNQFATDVRNVNCSDDSRLFSGVAIFVNGYTIPSSSDLKSLMIKYGGVYHHYYDSRKTTHVIASNLPNCKIKTVKDTKVVKPEWIVDSINENKLLDFRPYLLYTNQSCTQPKLCFKNDNRDVGVPSCSYDVPSDSVEDSCVNEFREIDPLIRKESRKCLSSNDEISTAANLEISHSDNINNKLIIDCNQRNPDDIFIKNSEEKDIFKDLPDHNSLDVGCTENSEIPKKCRITDNENKVNPVQAKINLGVKSNPVSKTATDKSFLAEFYSNSRLHHISTMGATFKQYVTELRSKNSLNQFPERIEIRKWLKEFECSDDGVLFDEKIGIDNEVNNIDDDDNEDVTLCSDSKGTFVRNKIRNFDEKIIMHIDMDCFFVSVGIRNKPKLKGHPVAVTHAKVKSNSHQPLRKESNFKQEISLYKNRIESKMMKENNITDDDDKKNDSSRYNWISVIGETDSMSEVASCSYEARKAGVKNGMFLGQALKLCPNLKTISYDFDAYKSVSCILYDTVAKYTLDIEPVSCDEMFVDCTKLLKEIPCTAMEFGSFLRKQIREKTDCPCSTGFGGNRLLARLATKKAKPDGQYFLQQRDLASFMKNILVSDLPGVGRALAYKLSSMKINNCEDLQNVSLSELKSEFGLKTGEALYNHCRGNDNRELIFGHVRKSVSAEVNYGIRFQIQDEVEKFLYQLSHEVNNRLQEINMKTKRITLKLMVKAKDAPEETAKFLGHGFCNNLSKSSSLSIASSDLTVISREVLSIYRKLQLVPKDLRGIGIQLSCLVPAKKNAAVALDKFLKPKDCINEIPKAVNELNNVAEKVNIIGTSCNTTDDDNSLVFVTKQSNSMNNVANSESKPENISKKIDEAVLFELPKDVRLEIMKNYKLRNENLLFGNNYKELNKGKGSKRGRKLMSDCTKVRKAVHFRTNHKELTISQIDQSFLRALPPNLQEEVLKEASHASNCRKQLLDDFSNISDKPILPNECLDSVDDCVNDDDSNDMSLDELRDLVRKWVAEESPLNDKINMISSFIVKYVYKHCLSDLQIIINTLFRSVKTKADDKCWNDAYFCIIKSVQEAMISEYGSELLLEYDFS